MSWLCRIGIHRWRAWVTYEDGVLRDWNACEREGCKYHRPSIVNVETRKPW